MSPHKTLLAENKDARCVDKKKEKHRGEGLARAHKAIRTPSERGQPRKGWGWECFASVEVLSPLQTQAAGQCRGPACRLQRVPAHRDGEGDCANEVTGRWARRERQRVGHTGRAAPSPCAAHYEGS